MRDRLKVSDGSIQNISEIPEEIRAIYRTVWEVPMRSLIDMAADRGAFIDQSQSLDLFVQSPNIGKGFYWDEAVLYLGGAHWNDAPAPVFWNGPVVRIAPSLENSLNEAH